MAKDNIGEYSSTAASNTVVGDVNIAEGTAPSNINNAIREVMSHLADAHGAVAAYQGVTNSITAGTTQTQGGATALTEPINRVTTVGTNGDGVKLPTATAGLSILVLNDDSAQTLKVWPNTSDAIDGGSANAVDANQVAAGASRLYVAIDATNWYTALNDLGTIPLGVASGGTGAATLTDGGILLGSGTGAITATAVLADGEILVGDGTTDPVAESGATARTSLGLGTGDSPQFTGVNVGAASDTTVTRASAGDLNIEGNIVYRAGGTDVPVADGGTGASTLTDGGVLLGSGTGAITAMSVLADGEIIVGDGSTDPVAESGATARTSLGLGTGDTPEFLGIDINQGAEDSEILSLISSDIDHGMSSDTGVSTFFFIKKSSATAGAPDVVGLGEGSQGIRILGQCTTANTAKSTSATAPILFRGVKKSSASNTVMGSDENVVVIEGCTAGTGFIFDAEGSMHSNAANAVYDEYADAELIRAVDRSLSTKGLIASKFDEFVEYSHEDLATAGIVGRDDDGSPNDFVNWMSLAKLHNGAIWQQAVKHENLLAAFHELAAAAIGEEKACEILDKHGVKSMSGRLLN